MSLKVNLDKELEKRFRELAMKQFGYSKGSIKKATHVAIEAWTKESARAMNKEVDGRKFVEEFVSIPKRKLKTRIDLKKTIEEEYEIR
jgi:hypothetical protein